MTQDTTGLSRRKVLLGLGAVGVASAGAGLGTTAYFSDGESFEDNSITAGQFELDVTQSTHTIDQDTIGIDEQNFNSIIQDDGIVEINDGFFNITDAKPGDSYKYCWDICVKHNPGFVQITLASQEWAGNDLENPVINGDFDSNAPIADADGTLGEFALAVVTLDDQQAGDSDEIVFQGTLGQLVTEWEDGGLVHASSELDPVTQTGVPEYCHHPCESTLETVELADETAEICVYLYLPSDADVGEEITIGGATFGPLTSDDSPGNLIQGASYEADVHFAAEQCRHNDSPFDGAYQINERIETILTADDAGPRGFGTSSDAKARSGSWQSSGTEKELLYLGPNPDFTDFETLPTFTVGEIDEISYWTNKNGGPGDVDFYLLIYTEPTGTASDDASWYNKRLNAEPYFLTLAGDQVSAPANQWNQWSTIGDSATDPLRFVDANRTGIGFGYSDGVMPTLQDIQSGSVDWSSLRSGGESTSIDYASQTVKTLAISTGSPWSSGFSGLLDAVVVRLTDGTELTVDLEQ